MKKAPIVALSFKDHTEATGNIAELAECIVFGALVKETDEAYFVCSWITDGQPFSIDSNIYTIQKHKGIKCQKLNLQT